MSSDPFWDDENSWDSGSDSAPAASLRYLENRHGSRDLPDAREQDQNTCGLDFAIRRERVCSHGVNIKRGDSPQGGLGAAARVRAEQMSFIFAANREPRERGCPLGPLRCHLPVPAAYRFQGHAASG